MSGRIGRRRCRAPLRAVACLPARCRTLARAARALPHAAQLACNPRLACEPPTVVASSHRSRGWQLAGHQLTASGSHSEIPPSSRCDLQRDGPEVPSPAGFHSLGGKRQMSGVPESWTDFWIGAIWRNSGVTWKFRGRLVVRRWVGRTPASLGGQVEVRRNFGPQVVVRQNFGIQHNSGLQVVVRHNFGPQVVVQQNSEPHVVVRCNSRRQVVVWQNSGPQVVVWGNLGPQVVVRRNSECQVVVRQNSGPQVVVRRNSERQVVVWRNFGGQEVVVRHNSGPQVVVRQNSGLRWWSGETPTSGGGLVELQAVVKEARAISDLSLVFLGLGSLFKWKEGGVGIGVGGVGTRVKGEKGYVHLIYY
ncbi:hypothetical protein M5K25_006732 [Dendrobium thyrsiflorum]|uniref:Uncharacterized protein n=1 Tax=Dendrobium thyrsiflorum TaxID=117978 RepID=A0ABD0VJ80_DENTH